MGIGTLDPACAEATRVDYIR